MLISSLILLRLFFFFFFNDTATTEIYTLSLHDALPIPPPSATLRRLLFAAPPRAQAPRQSPASPRPRSEEHTSELQSQSNLVCRLLLEKKNKTHIPLFLIKKKKNKISK